MKNSNENIGNRTRDLPACNAVPQPTASPRDPNETQRKYKLEGLCMFSGRYIGNSSMIS